jgi:hypothetical protein
LYIVLASKSTGGRELEVVFQTTGGCRAWNQRGPTRAVVGMPSVKTHTSPLRGLVFARRVTLGLRFAPAWAVFRRPLRGVADHL